MRRKLLAIIAMLCMVFSMVGCSQEGENLLGKIKEINGWEAVEQTGNMDFSAVLAGETVGVKADYTAYTNVKAQQAEMTLTIKEIKVGNKTLDTTKGETKLSPAKMFISNTNLYLNTQFVKDVMKLANVKAPASVDMSKEYIALDLTSYLKQIGFDEKNLNSEAQFKQLTDLYDKLKLDVPVKQDKDTYTIALDENKMVDLFFKFVNGTMEAQKEQLTAQYKQLGLTDEEIKQVFAEVKQAYSDATKAEAAKALKGSTATCTYAFGKDSCDQKIALDLKATIEKETIGIKFTLNNQSKKAAEKKVSFPANAKVYDFLQLLGSVETISEAATASK